MFGHRAFRCFSKSFCKNTKDVILTQWTCDCKSHFYRNQRFISIVSKWGGNGLLSLIDFVKLGVATCLKFQKPKRIWVCWFKHLSSMKWAKTCRDRFSNAIIRKQPAQWTQTQHIISTHHIIISHHLPSFLLSIISLCIEFSDPKKASKDSSDSSASDPRQRSSTSPVCPESMRRDAQMSSRTVCAYRTVCSNGSFFQKMDTKTYSFFLENFWKGIKTAQCTAHSVQVVKLFGATVCAMPPNATWQSTALAVLTAVLETCSQMPRFSICLLCNLADVLLLFVSVFSGATHIP